MVFRTWVFKTWDLNFGTWMWDLNFGTWISHMGFTVAFGHGHPLVYLYNILGWSSFPSIRPVILLVIHPSKFLIPEEEDDGRGGGRMAASTVYPNVYVIQSRSVQILTEGNQAWCFMCRVKP
jgi:hypothetical protein